MTGPRITIRPFLSGFFVLALLLTACGGGSADPATVALFGDSLSTGGGLAVKPAERMRQLLPGVAIADYSAPSMRAADALAGNPAFPSFAGHLAQVDVALILYGGADVIGRTDPAQFETAMRQLVAMAQLAGARVVLATVIRHPLYLAQIAPINDAIRRIAADTASELADVYALPTGGLWDGIHPDQAYADARVAVIAQAVRATLSK